MPEDEAVVARLVHEGLSYPIHHISVYLLACGAHIPYHFFAGPVLCLFARYDFFSSYTATGGGLSPYSAATSRATPSAHKTSAQARALTPLLLSLQNQRGFTYVFF